MPSTIQMLRTRAIARTLQGKSVVELGALSRYRMESKPRMKATAGWGMLLALALVSCARAPSRSTPSKSAVWRGTADRHHAEGITAERKPGQATVQVKGPIEDSYEPTTDEIILNRLEKVLEEVPANASVPRIALADVAYPRSQRELEALGGFGLLLVTVVCHVNAEVPVAGVEVHAGGKTIDLPLVNSRTGAVNAGRMARVLGKYRFDGVYLIPVFVTRIHAKVVVRFRGGSALLEPLRFPRPPGQKSLPEGLRFDWEPREPQIDALRGFLKAEFPLIPAEVQE